MIENTPSSPSTGVNKHRVRPKSNWHFPAAIGGMVLIFLIGLGSGYLLWGRPLANARSELATVNLELEQVRAEAQAMQDAASQAATPDPTTEDSQVQQVTRYPVAEDDDPSFGPENAPITIIEFSDFQCPYCQRWHDQVWSQIIAAYPDQVRLVYRDFPLYSIHPEAGPAANAANCALEQDQYWAYHDLLFSGSEKLGSDAYLKYAGDLGLDLTIFQQCLDEGRYEEEVTADYEYAVGIGIQSTPTFFINGIALIGAQPFEVFQEVIELELAGKLSQ